MISSDTKHKIKFHTKYGKAYREAMTWFGLKLIRLSRKLLHYGFMRCSYCGANCAFDSTISNKGLRCSSLHKNCDKAP